MGLAQGRTVVTDQGNLGGWISAGRWNEDPAKPLRTSSNNCAGCWINRACFVNLST